jgi:hypothetical protein
MTATGQGPSGGGNNPPPVSVTVSTKEANDQFISAIVAQRDINIGDRPKRETPLSSLLEELPKLPQSLHPFHDPIHGNLLQILEQRRIVLLKSYREEAAYAAGHALINDQELSKDRKKLALFPTRRRDKERADLELMSVTEGEFLKEPQVLLIGIGRMCLFFESILDADHDVLVRVSRRLEQSRSYMILSVDESLLDGEEIAEKISGLYVHEVSHIRYLLSRDYAERAAEFESRLNTALGSLSTPAARREHYQRIADYLARGTAAFERFLDQLEAMHLTPELRTAQLRSIEPAAIFKEDSEVHRTAAYVAACFPELNQRDFDRLVRLLLGDESTTKEDIRQAFRRDGKLITTREKTEERCEKRWLREADKIFHECHLRTVISGNGSWVVDFSEPYLRDELRTYLNQHHPWFLRKQCERLQASGILFFGDLSPKAVEGLVGLFIERAIVDPTEFGSLWLLDLVVSGRAAIRSDALTKTPDEMPTWLKELRQEYLRDRFQERLCVLLREMFDHDALRPVIQQFFKSLIASSEHDALLEIILDLTPRLRFVPDFDPLPWMRRLLNEGRNVVRTKVIAQLVYLARRSGPKIYEFLEAVHAWLPDSDSAPADYSVSNQVALEFPFMYCAEMAKWVEPGIWPAQYPLFYALPDESAEAEKRLDSLIEWIIDPRGAVLEKADDSNPMKSAEAVRIALVADLVELWLRILEGPPSKTPPPEGVALFAVILEKLHSKLGPRERTWLQRSWQQQQDEQFKEAGTRVGQERKYFIGRKTNFEQLRMRFAALTNTPRIPVQGEPTS